MAMANNEKMLIYKCSCGNHWQRTEYYATLLGVNKKESCLNCGKPVKPVKQKM